VTGEVADIRPYLAAGSALVVPLRSGGGTRLKILQAMAMERPVISTSLGAEGLEVQPGVNILIADDPAQFVRQIRWLISELAADRLGKADRLVEDKYDWRMCLYGLERLYDNTGNPRSSNDRLARRNLCGGIMAQRLSSLCCAWPTLAQHVGGPQEISSLAGARANGQTHEVAFRQCTGANQGRATG
jgi:hypothetical protein